jgi:anaerobic magnesium-protoporphyrin IX monomethyl ester cyclase
MKVMLIMPNFRWAKISSQYIWDYFPNNLCVLAAMIEDICEVTILDAFVNDYSPAEVRHFIEQYKPDLAGVTCMINQCAPVAYETLSLIKQERPMCLTALGGVYATVEPEDVMKMQSVDYAFVGEGEYTLRTLILFLCGQGEFPEKGVWFRKNGQVIDKGRSDFIENLDVLPMPAYHLIDYPKYSKPDSRRTVESPNIVPNARILTSRGCPHHCSFCQVEKVSGRKFRARSANNILDEIEFLKSEYGIQSLTFDDDNLHTSRKRAIELFTGMIQRSLTMPWKAITTAVWRLDEDQIDLMKKSGCTYVNISIEAGSKRVREELIQKPIDIEYAKKMVNYLQKCNIYVAGNIIMGYPTETWEEIRESLILIEEMNVDYVKLFPLIPLKHTKAWEHCTEAGLLPPGASSETISWYALNCSEFTAAELSILRAFEWDRINFSSKEKRIKTANMMGITIAELDTMRKKARRNACLQVKEYPIPVEYL